MSARRSVLGRILPLALLLIPLAGCADEVAQYCTKKAQCEGGNDKDINACIYGVAGTIKETSAYGCKDPYDKVMQCLYSRGMCVNGKYGADCSAEQNAVNQCLTNASKM